MKMLVVGDCTDKNVYRLVDPSQFVEVDFEAEVVRAFTCLLPEYMCGVFAGGFVLEGERRLADLALVHKSFSHWFIVEVEMAGHSLEHHVLPQVRCFRYGIAETSCVTSLMRGFKGITRDQAEGLLKYVPHSVAVVSNRADATWTATLGALDAQHLTLSVYRNSEGQAVHELEGRLTYRVESLGFAQFSAVDNSLRLARSWGLAEGTVRIVDQFGNPGEWTVRRESEAIWVSKAKGPALIPHNEYVQIVRSSDGDLSIRLSPH